MSKAFEYDIVVEAPDHTRVLVVECKRMKLTSDTEAAQLRRSLMSLGRDLAAAYFMLALPTGIFLWKGDAAADASPQFSAAVKPVLQSYLGPVADRPGGPRSESLEIAVSSWLSDLASGIRKPDSHSEPERMIVQAGLFERLKGGVVKMHVSA